MGLNIEPDHVAATRVISVIATPVGNGEFDSRVDYDDWISIYEAYGILYATVCRIEQQFQTATPESEERGDD